MSTTTRRVAMVVVGVLAAGYIAMMSIWISPSNPIRDAVVPKIRGIMSPHLAQGWSLFAPGIINANKTLLIRAEIPDSDSGTRITEWVDIGAIEAAKVRHRLQGTKDMWNVHKLSQDMRSTYLDIPKKYRAVVENDYDNPEGILYVKALRANGVDDKVSSSARSSMNRWTRQEQAARGLVTLYAYNLWQVKPVRVQWTIKITGVPRFANRGTDKYMKPSTVNVGWRAAVNFPDATWATWK